MNPKATTYEPLNVLNFWFLSILVGIVAGLGAVGFRGLIAFFHNLLFFGALSVHYNANMPTPASPWGPLVVLVPVAGALGVAFLVTNFAPEARGAGVPEVMDAIYYRKGIIRPVLAGFKAVASALSVGSGASVGREGPVIQIGSSFGSTLGQRIPMLEWQRITLMAGGAGGGIAATFNTPVGGLLFAIELIMFEVSIQTLVPVLISTATATYIGRLFFGAHPSFVIPSFEAPHFPISRPEVLAAYVVLGGLVGLLAAGFVKGIYGFEDIFDRFVPGNYYSRHATGMLVVGGMMYLLMLRFGRYYIEGVGYATVQEILLGAETDLFLLLLLFALKLLATSLSLGSGASGGIFSPSLFMGATFGGAYGTLLNSTFPQLHVSPPAFAVAGMAGFVGGATGAAVAAIVMIFEMTLSYDAIIPITITVAIADGIRRLLSRESVYTEKLVRRGHYVPEALEANAGFVRHAGDVMQTRFAVVSASDGMPDLARAVAQHMDTREFLVRSGGRVVGLISRSTALEALVLTARPVSAGDIASRDYIVVAQDTTLFDVIISMRAEGASVALVARRAESDDSGSGRRPEAAREDEDLLSRVLGLITRERIAEVFSESAEYFSD